MHPQNWAPGHENEVSHQETLIRRASDDPLPACLTPTLKSLHHTMHAAGPQRDLYKSSGQAHCVPDHVHACNERADSLLPHARVHGPSCVSERGGRCGKGALTAYCQR